MIFSLPISAERPHPADAARSSGCCRSTSASSAHTNKLRFRPRSYSYIGNVPVLDVFDRPIADWDVVMKWLFDKIVGALALIALSPVMLLVALAIKLDSSGPVLFKQKRYGFNNELIEVYKFRSMYTDMTRRDRREARHQGRSARHPRRPLHPQDPLDELPQLFNVVFKGNLSLVGPRPHAVHAKAENQLYDEVVDGYFARHRVKPGITGWAQINGWRGETDTPGEDPAARRARPLLHRELVGAVRPLHPGHDAVRAAQDRERLLMAARHAPMRPAAPALPRVARARPARRAAAPAAALADGASGALVFIEPSPYEIVVAARRCSCSRVSGLDAARRAAAAGRAADPDQHRLHASRPSALLGQTERR